MFKKTLLMVALLTLFASSAFAHQYTLTFSHLVNIAVPAVAQDREVVSATATVGVLATKHFLPGYGIPGQNFAPFVTGKKTVELEKDGEFFKGKARTDVQETGLSPRMGSVMMTLTLRFADGEQLTLRDEVVKVKTTKNTNDYQSYNEAMTKELNSFNEGQDFTETSVTTVSLYIRGAGVGF